MFLHLLTFSLPLISDTQSTVLVFSSFMVLYFYIVFFFNPPEIDFGIWFEDPISFFIMANYLIKHHWMCFHIYMDFFFFIFGHSMAHGVSGRGIRCKLQSWPKPQLQQHHILYTLRWPGDRTHAPVLPRCGQSHCTIAGTPGSFFLNIPFYCIYLSIYLYIYNMLGSFL